MCTFKCHLLSFLQQHRSHLTLTNYEHYSSKTKPIKNTKRQLLRNSYTQGKRQTNMMKTRIQENNCLKLCALFLVPKLLIVYEEHKKFWLLTFLYSDLINMIMPTHTDTSPYFISSKIITNEQSVVVQFQHQPRSIYYPIVSSLKLLNPLT